MLKKLTAVGGCLLFAALFLGALIAQAAEKQPSVALPQADVSSVQDLRINEFMASNTQTITDTFGEYDDWIEIYNSGTTAVNLNGLYLTDKSDQLTQYHITQSLSIPAKGFVVVWADSDVDQNSSNEIHTNFGLSANGDSIYIVAANGTTIIDSYTYDNTQGGSDVSQGRLPDGTGSFQSFTLGTAQPPSPGRSNAAQPPFISAVNQNPQYPTSANTVTIEATITDDVAVTAATLYYKVNNGAFTSKPMSAQGGSVYATTIPPQSTDAVVRYYVKADDAIGSSTSEIYLYVVGYVPPTLVINEIMADNKITLPDPDGTGEYDDWIELYNYGGSAVSLDGLVLADMQTQFAITDGLSIPAGGYMLFWADNTTAQGPQHTNFALSSSGDAVGLYGANGLIEIDYYDFGNSESDESRSRIPNGTGEFSKTENATPAYSNDQEGVIISNVVHTPSQPAAGQTVNVTAQVTSGAPGGSIETVVIFYTVNNGVEQSGVMAPAGGDDFSFTIPANSAGAVVKYYITAVDNYTVNSRAYALGKQSKSPFYGYVVGYQAPELYINEYMVTNTNVLEDPDELGEYPDWIEIYNPGNTAVNLAAADLYLTDEADNPNKFALTGVIPAKGFILFYADNDPSQGSLHTNFRLTTNSGYIGLFGAQGFVEITSRAYSAQTVNVSEGLYPDGTLPYIKFDSNPRPPTPGHSNSQQAPIITNRTQSPNFPNSSNSVTITADVKDDGTLQEVKFIYKVNNGAAQTLNMTKTEGDTYQAVVPAQAAGATVSYYFRAKDNSNNTTVSPPGAPASMYSYQVYDGPVLYINEYMADNQQYLEDPNEPGSYPDWIEIYNPSNAAVNLTGLYLTDDINNSDQFPISGVSVPAKGFVLFYAGNAPAGVTAAQAKFYTGFGLSSSGDTVAIYGGSNAQVPIDVRTFTGQLPDVSEGRSPDGGSTFRRFNVPTPKASNALKGPKITNTTVSGGIVQANTPAKITMNVQDDGQLVNIVVRYRISGGSYVDATVTPVSGQPNKFQATIPGRPNGTKVDYYVWAIDNDDVVSTDPAGGASGPHSYTVGQPVLGIKTYLPLLKK